MSRSVTDKTQTNFLSLCRLSLPKESMDWVEDSCAKITQTPDLRTFQIAFGMASRKVEEKIVHFQDETHPSYLQSWTTLECGRSLMMHSLPHSEQEKVLEQTFQMSNWKESVVLYKNLPFFHDPTCFHWRAVEGVRTNVIPIFDSIAHHNPFPATFFSEDEWNQMVLKAIFLDRPLLYIHKVKERRNDKLDEMLLNYVAERWAARRNVTPEIWRMLQNIPRELISKLIESDWHWNQEVVQLLKQDIVHTNDWTLLGKKYHEDENH